MATVVDPTICPIPQVELIETDGEPLESDWHRLCMSLLIEAVTWHLRGRTDYFVGGNMFIYFNEKQARNRDFRGPDFFFVEGATLNPPRPYWAVWLEGGRYPDLIIELSSPTTAEEDRTTKKDIYERVFRAFEYFIYDPTTGRLEGWRLINNHYEPITPNERGWLWCQQLGLWLGTWKGKFQEKEDVYVRFHDGQGNPVPIPTEVMQQEAWVAFQRTQVAKEQAEAAQRKAELAQQQAESAKQEAEAARQQAQAARLQAEVELKRAQAAEAELARLKAQLGEQHRNEGGT